MRVNIMSTVEPPNKGHIGTSHVVHYKEVVLTSGFKDASGKWTFWDLEVHPSKYIYCVLWGCPLSVLPLSAYHM